MGSIVGLYVACAVDACTFAVDLDFLQSTPRNDEIDFPFHEKLKSASTVLCAFFDMMKS